MATSKQSAKKPVVNGQFYSTYKRLRSEAFPKDVFDAAELAVEKLMGQVGSEAGPVMMLGKVQSGKTRTFLTSVLLSMDNDFELVIVLTKNSIPLAQQTVSRMKGEFAEVVKSDDVKVGIQVFDVMGMPDDGLPLAQIKYQRVVIVAKKQQHNISRLIALLENQPELAKRKCLLVDDEADNVTIGYKSAGEAATVAGLINDLREKHSLMAMLQVTATPQAAYLQATEITLKDQKQIRSLKPATTVFAPIPADYVGGEVYYGERSRQPGTLESFLHVPVDPAELVRIKKGDRRVIQPARVLDLPQIGGLRTAIVQFLVGAAILRLLGNAKEDRKTPEKHHYCMLVHIATDKIGHGKQAEMAETIVEKLLAARESRAPIYVDLLREAYQSLMPQVKASGAKPPRFEAALGEIEEVLDSQGFVVKVVNSENEVAKMLDDSGQIKLVCPFTVFVGGSSLDRGVTLSNLISFFYGRSPVSMQADTAMQHSRMYGYRRPLLGVTRLHTTPDLKAKFTEIERTDAMLWEDLRKNPDAPVVFLERAKEGGIIPCSPTKLKPNRVGYIFPWTRMLPVGFKTRPRAGRGSSFAAYEQLDQVLRSRAAEFKRKEVWTIDVEEAIDLLQLVEHTLFWDKGTSDLTWPWERVAEVLRFTSSKSGKDKPTSSSEWGKVHIWAAFDRRLKRTTGVAPFEELADNPDSKDEAEVAAMHAVNSPILLLVGQRGRAVDGWDDAPFYWPVIRVPQNVRRVAFNDGQKLVSWNNP